MKKNHFLYILFYVPFASPFLVKGLTCSAGKGVNPYGLILTDSTGCTNDEGLIESETECREAQILNKPTDNNKGWDLLGGSYVYIEEAGHEIFLGKGIYKEDHLPYGFRHDDGCDMMLG